MSKENVAIFIDYDNLYVALEKYYETHSDRTVKTKILAAIKERYRDSNLFVLKAFADFQKVAPVLTDIQKLQVQLRHVYSQNPDSKNRKNASDIALAIDVMKTLSNKEHIDTFVLVSSDSDMLPLVEELKYSGKKVVLIYSEFCSTEGIDQYVNTSITVESLIGKEVYKPIEPLGIEQNMFMYLQVINKKLWDVNRKHKGKGTCSKKDINDALCQGVEVVNNDVPIIIEYLFKEEVLIESPIQGTRFPKVLINPDWFATSGLTLASQILMEKDFNKDIVTAR
jgi:uncharacterized LabA/DUF88 family protein